jgi:hypothetical protein
MTSDFRKRATDSVFLHQQECKNEISTELAASVVKQYVLPMFENKEKKTLTTKYSMLNRKYHQDHLKKEPQTVYGELKLSEKLSNEVSDLKAQLNTLHEEYDELKYNFETEHEELL